jgi:hypothetical protein
VIQSGHKELPRRGIYTPGIQPRIQRMMFKPISMG